MREGRGRVGARMQGAGAVLVGVAVAFVASCRFDRGELYEPRGGGAGAGNTAAVVEIPPLPAQPDMEVRPACEACAAEKCGDAHSACLEDDACTALLVCKGICDDPACLSDCEAEHGFSPWYDDLFGCVLNTSCAIECRSGANWGCVDEYEWPAAGESRFPVTFSFEDPRTSASRLEPVWVGAQARTCRGADSPCVLSNLIDSNQVSAADRVQLGVVVSGRNFMGMVELEDPSNGPFGLRERLLWLPLDREVEVRVFALDRAYIQVLSSGAIDVENGAPLSLYAIDCLGVPGRGLRIELPSLPAAEVRYLAGSGLGSPLGEGPTNDTGYALLADVPEPQRADEVTVRGVRDATGDVVAERRNAFVRAGWTTHLLLFPRPR